MCLKILIIFLQGEVPLSAFLDSRANVVALLLIAGST